MDINGIQLPAANGFYMVNTIVNTSVNGSFVPTPVTDTYYFDTNGNMLTGWVETPDGKKYYFEAAKTSEEGKMALNWKLIDGAWYYFSADGSMLTNSLTPDGFMVGADGKMVVQ